MMFAKVLVLCLLPSLAVAQPLAVQSLHRFTPSAAVPNGPLTQGPGGDFHGVTESKAIIRLTPGGQVSIVAQLSGRTPIGPLTLAAVKSRTASTRPVVGWTRKMPSTARLAPYSQPWLVTLLLQSWLGGRAGIYVQSQSPGGDRLRAPPLVVERATYASPAGVRWSRGGNALATPLP